MEISNTFKNNFQTSINYDEEIGKISPSGFICDGIIDFSNFTNLILKGVDENAKIIQITEFSAFLIFDVEIKRFYKNIIKKIQIYNYDIYSIIANDSLSLQTINEFQQNPLKIIYKNTKINMDNKNIIYFCFKYNNDIGEIITNLKNKNKIVEILFSHLHADRYYFSFNNFSDLISVYAEIIQNRIWPIFVFPPKMSKLLHKEVLIENNIQFTRKFSGKYPFFQAEKYLYYIAFIEPTIKNHQRIKNCPKLYNIDDILDAQICYIFKEDEKTIRKGEFKSSKTFHSPTIRTFLGFDSQFRCLRVYDYLIDTYSKGNSILDVILVDYNYSFNFQIKHNLFYLEVPNVYFGLGKSKSKIIDPSIVYSINCINSFKNCENFSSLFSFKKEKDLLDAKNLFSNLKRSRKINRIRMIEPDDYFDFFGKENAEMISKSNLSFLIFQLKAKNDDKSKEFQIKGAKKIFQDILCIKDNRYYNIVGLQSKEEREKLYCLLKNSKYSKIIKSFYPETKQKPKNNSSPKKSFKNAPISHSNSANSPTVEFSPLKPINRAKSSDQPANVSNSEKFHWNADKNSKNQAKIMEFEPKQGFTYFYVEEIEATRPSSSIVSNNVGLFGIQNIDELQRSFYLPGTDKICTFFGFLDKKQAEISIRNRNLSKTKSRCAYFYNQNQKLKQNDSELESPTYSNSSLASEFNQRQNLSSSTNSNNSSTSEFSPKKNLSSSTNSNNSSTSEFSTKKNLSSSTKTNNSSVPEFSPKKNLDSTTNSTSSLASEFSPKKNLGSTTNSNNSSTSEFNPKKNLNSPKNSNNSAASEFNTKQNLNTSTNSTSSLASEFSPKKNLSSQKSSNNSSASEFSPKKNLNSSTSFPNMQKYDSKSNSLPRAPEVRDFAPKLPKSSDSSFSSSPHFEPKRLNEPNESKTFPNEVSPMQDEQPETEYDSEIDSSEEENSIVDSFEREEENQSASLKTQIENSASPFSNSPNEAESSSSKSFTQILSEELNGSSKSKKKQENAAATGPKPFTQLLSEESSESANSKPQESSKAVSGLKPFTQLLSEESSESANSKPQESSKAVSGPKPFTQLLSEESSESVKVKPFPDSQPLESSQTQPIESERYPGVKDFAPLPNLHYIYIEESTPKFISSQSSDTTFYGIEYIDDVQRFYYLPKTNRICTFMGFLDPKMAENAKKNPNFKGTKTNGAVDYKVQISVQRSTNSPALTIFQPKPKPNNSTENQTTTSTTQQQNDSILISQPNKSESNKTSILIKPKNDNSTQQTSIIRPPKSDQTNPLIQQASITRPQKSNQNNPSTQQTSIVRPQKGNQISIDLSEKAKKETEQKMTSISLPTKSSNQTITLFTPKSIQPSSSSQTTVKKSTPEISIKPPSTSSLSLPLKPSSSSSSTVGEFEVKRPTQIIQRSVTSSTQNESDKDFENAEFFSPKPNLLYFYFADNAPKKSLISGKTPQNNLYGIIHQDQQRYVKHPNKNDGVLYTFLGFENNDQREIGISKYESLAFRQKSKIYMYEKEDENIEEVKIHVKVNSPAKIQQDTYYAELFDLSIPKEIREKISETIFENNLNQNSQTGVINISDQNYIETIYSTKSLETFEKIKNIFHKVICNDFNFHPLEIKNNDPYFYFDEIFMPKKNLNQFISYLKVVPGVYNIQRNVFYQNKIATYFFYQKVNSEKVLNSIKDFLLKNDLLFDQRKYFLKNTIIINEDLILQNKDDFDIIVNEISKIGIKTLKIERDKLFVYQSNQSNKLFQKFSFICFENEKDKINALNHINQIVFGNKKNVLVLEPNLHYAKVQYLSFSPKLRAICKSLYQTIPDLKMFHTNSLSIENPITCTYLGFTSTRALNLGITLLRFRLFLKSKDANYAFFTPVQNIKYIRIQQEIFNKLCSKNLIDLSHIHMYTQYGCQEMDEENLKSFNYIGFDDMKNYRKMIRELSTLQAKRPFISFQEVNDDDNGEDDEDEKLIDADEICFFGGMF